MDFCLLRLSFENLNSWLYFPSSSELRFPVWKECTCCWPERGTHRASGENWEKPGSSASCRADQSMSPEDNHPWGGGCLSMGQEGAGAQGPRLFAQGPGIMKFDLVFSEEPMISASTRASLTQSHKSLNSRNNHFLPQLFFSPNPYILKMLSWVLKPCARNQLLTKTVVQIPQQQLQEPSNTLQTSSYYSRELGGTSCVFLCFETPEDGHYGNGKHI